MKFVVAPRSIHKDLLVALRKENLFSNVKLISKEELIKYRPDVENRKQFSASNIVITTFHQAKGLEFDYVFIPDVIEGRIPAGMAVSECRVEEERRLFYVALTRAKEELYVYTIKNEESGSSLPSRFIEKFVY